MVLAHSLFGIFNASRLLYHQHYFLHFVPFLVMTLYYVDHKALVFFGGIIKGIDEREGHFLLFDINPAGLATFIGELVVKKVVFDLERDAQPLPEVTHSLDYFGRASHRSSTKVDLAWPLCRIPNADPLKSEGVV